MPFKIKLKKSRHYSVVSKSSCVISVEMLDGSNLEYSLSLESTGQECLNYVCQKLSLNQPKFFGLQYMNKNPENQFSWIELDRPIKRQLEKYARSFCVHLRVMYYVVSGAKLLNDEVTRYHYFLQLKMDVIEGRISCSPEQAIELAAYCMQAEFGNYDPEKHTAHYLKDFQLFPRAFSNPDLLEMLTEAASNQHAALHNLPQGTAEEYYICACQKLNGYGQELYRLKDHAGNDVIIGISLVGITINYPGSSQKPRQLKWLHIKNIINHKKHLIIEVIDGSDKLLFQFSDVETAKNSWKFCVLQHTFFRQYETTDADQKEEVTPPSFSLHSSEEKLKVVSSSYERPVTWECSNSAPTLVHATHSLSNLALDQSQQQPNVDVLKSLLPSYRPAPDYETAIQQKYGKVTVTEPSNNPHAILYSSQPEIHQKYPDVTHTNMEKEGQFLTVYNPQLMAAKANNSAFDLRENLFMGKPPPPYPSRKINSNSTPDLAGLSQYSMSQSYLPNIITGSSPDLVSCSSMFLKQHYPWKYANSGQPIHRSQSYLTEDHTKYENLPRFFKTNLAKPSHAMIVEGHNIAKYIRKLYDEHGNVIYCMPSNIKQLLQENQLQNSVLTRSQNIALAHSAVSSSSTEPIYENVPLPWQNENTYMRARTQSIHSAPEISQVANHNLINRVQSQMQDLHLNNPNVTKENLYANINTTPIASSSRINLTVEESNRNTPANASSNFPKTYQNANTSSLFCTSSKSDCEAINTVNIEGYNSSYLPNKPMERSMNFAGTSHVSENSSTLPEISGDASRLPITSSSKSKKKRWALSIGRTKSIDKLKSLSRKEKEKKDAPEMDHECWATSLPPSFSKEKMCHLLESKLNDSQLFSEFDKIPKRKRNANFATALHPENARFNSFADILPYEENRIRLTPSRDNKFGYINASHITATIGKKQKFYIAAQGPTKETLPYFWQCIWESEVYLIVQLTDFTQDFSYIPHENNKYIEVGKDFRLWWEFAQASSNMCITSKIKLCRVSSQRCRTLWHLQFSDWDEHACPRSPSNFLAFLEEIQSVFHYSMTEIPPGHNQNHPILVHCTAGVGRTGLTILCDLLLCTIDHNQEVCVPCAMTLLRHQRPFMLQTVSQYRFVYSFLIYYLRQTRLI